MKTIPLIRMMRSIGSIAITGLLAVGLMTTAQAQPKVSNENPVQSFSSKPTPEQVDVSIIQLVKTFLTAVQRGDHATAKNLLHPNLIWDQPGNNRFSGTKNSKADLLQMIKGMTDFSANTLQMTNFDQLSVNGNQVACRVHWKAIQEAGGRLDVDNIDVYTVENGRILKVTVYSVDIAQENDFWGR